MQGVLHGLEPSDVVDDPFPHLIVETALQPDYYQRLCAEFPAPAILLKGSRPKNNKAYRYGAHKALTNPSITQAWKCFLEYHVSWHFFQDVVRVFGDRIRTRYPHLERRAGKPLEEFQSSIRNRGESGDVTMECQFSYGSPVILPTRMRGPHVDREIALYAGLLYFRLPKDRSHGGDLRLYRFKTGQRQYENRRGVDLSRVEVVKTIRYAPNTLVLMLHTPDSLHGVTRRSITRHPRLHVNFVAEFEHKVFDLGT